MARLSLNHPKIRLLMARGFTFPEAQVAVRKAERFQAEAEAEAVTLARREEALAKRAAVAPPQRVHLRLRARQIQLKSGCDLGSAQLRAERERAEAREQAERSIKRVAQARQPATPPAARAPAPAPTRAPAVTPVAPMPLAKGKTRLLSATVPDGDERPVLMVRNVGKVFGNE